MQRKELNKNGEFFMRRYPKLKLRVVDGSSLAVAIVLNSIPKGTSEVLVVGNLTKVARSVAFALCERGIQVCSFNRLLVPVHDYHWT